MSIMPARVDKDKAITDVKARGLTLREAAKLQNCSHQAIHRIVQNLSPNDVIETYLSGRATAFAERGALLLNLVDEPLAKRLWDKNPTAACLLLNSLYNNERLERGQATSIMDHRVLSARVEEIHAKIAKVEATEAQVIDVPRLPDDMGVDLGVSQDMADKKSKAKQVVK